jgi:ankyrin repeat protein
LVSLLLAGNATAGTDLRLADAVKNKKKDAVRALLKERVDVNERQGDGTTALHWAAYWNDLDTADLLIRAGANVNAATDVGVTPLYLAAEVASAPMTEKLLAAGADSNAAAETGVTPLMLAARGGSVDAVRALLARKANVNAKENSAGQTALMWAVAQEHPQVVQALLERGADPHARTKSESRYVVRGGPGGYDLFTDVEWVKAGGSTALLFAAGRGSIDSAKLLLEFGANVNDMGADGNSALVVAAHSGHGAFATFLLERGANVNADGAGYTVLHAAVLRGDLDLLKASLAHGANPNARLANGTPYRRQSADYYLSSDLVGATPLILSAKYASADMIQALVAAGADITLAANDGTTALIAAANATDNRRQPESLFLKVDRQQDEKMSLEAVRALLDLHADVDAVNEAGDTALHIAVTGRSDTIIQLLAEKGAKLDVKNKKGLTPLAMVSAGGRRGAGGGAAGSAPTSTAELLRKLGAKQ